MQVDAATLGYMIDHGDELHIMCMHGRCSHGGKFTLEWLVDLLGREHSSLTADIIRSLKAKRKRLRCSVCGGYQINLIRIHRGYTGHRED